MQALCCPTARQAWLGNAEGVSGGRQFGLVHVSAGDLLREEVAAGTSAGQRAKGCMDEGRLVPNEVVVGMVKARPCPLLVPSKAQAWTLSRTAAVGRRC